MLTEFIISLLMKYFDFHANITESDKAAIMQFIYFVANTDGLTRADVDEWMTAKYARQPNAEINPHV